MIFYAFGLNHRRAPVELRECFALDEKAIRGLYRKLSLGVESEAILLSTCNRTEAYLFGTSYDVEAIQNLLAEAACREWPEQSAFLLEDEDAVRHVLEVAAGLRSLVLGDAQIFTQLKEAYRIAVEEQCVGTTMHRLMHTAFRTAKRVVNETDLSTGAASVPHLAVEVATSHFQARTGRRPDELTALVIGTGSMGVLSAEALTHAGVKDLAFTNRTADRGRHVAAKYGASFVDWADRHAECRRREIVIVATSAETPVLSAHELAPLERKGETLLLDISVPRNVDNAVGRLSGFDVIDLDELNRFLVDAETQRKTAVPHALQITGEMLSEFVTWVFHRQALEPAIQAIADTFETIRRQEVRRHYQRFSDSDKEELDRITRSIIQKILAVPVVRLKSVDPESVDFVQGVRLLHALFRREECEEGGEGEAQNASIGPAAEEMIGREDCPIEPQTAGLDMAGNPADLDLDEIFRLIARKNADEPE